MRECIEVMKEALKEVSLGNTVMPLRMATKLGEGKLLGLMPAYLPYKNVAGAKILTIFHKNYEKGLPSHQGEVLLFETETGSVKGMVDGTAITTIRTAAVSAVATDILADKDSGTLAILGAGVQARSHIEAMFCVRPIKKVFVWSIIENEAKKLADEFKGKYDALFEVCKTAQEAVRGADIICTVTSAKTPILSGEWVKKGAHINAVGACTPLDRELSSDLVAKARFFGDRLESVINESGDYLFPFKEGLITQEHIVGEIGEALAGKIAGRLEKDDITIFKALGLAVEDIAAADYILSKQLR
jgi:ornithine cyclodeaminase